MRILPIFNGYTIDYRLKEIRRVQCGEAPMFIPFSSQQGKELLRMAWENSHLVIRCEDEDSDAWVCVCGNRPTVEGFFPCDWSGEKLEPGLEPWPDALYLCGRCGRIIDADTLAVMSLDSDRAHTAAG